MKVIVRLIIVSFLNEKVYVSTDMDLLPSMELESQPIDTACKILERVCGVKCLPDEFVFSDLHSDESTLNITYAVIVPYIHEIKDKMIELNTFGSRLNDVDKAILEKVAYIL